MARVLLVHDDPARRDDLTTILQRAGFEIRYASHREAAGDCEWEDIAAVVVGINPPAFEGVKTIADVSRQRTGLPVVGISAINDQLRRLIERTARALGATGVLFEPVPVQALTELLGGRRNVGRA